MSEVNDDTPVTFSMLEKWAEGFVGVVKSEIGKMLDERENRLSQNVAAQIDPLNARMNEVVGWINNQGGSGGQPEHAQMQMQRPRINLGELGAQIRELVAAAKEANIIPGAQPSELERWGMAAAETAQREALLSIKRQVRAGMRKGLIDRPTVESIVDETLDRTMGGSSHEPIL